MSHPAGIRTEADMWHSFFDKIEAEGFDYALSDYSNEVCAIDTRFRALVAAHISTRAVIETYLAARGQELDRELVL